MEKSMGNQNSIIQNLDLFRHILMIFTFSFRVEIVKARRGIKLQ